MDSSLTFDFHLYTKIGHAASIQTSLASLLRWRLSRLHNRFRGQFRKILTAMAAIGSSTPLHAGNNSNNGTKSHNNPGIGNLIERTDSSASSSSSSWDMLPQVLLKIVLILAKYLSTLHQKSYCKESKIVFK